MTKGKQLAWARSIPVELRVSGIGVAGVATLRALRDYDPAILVMWDQARQAVVIWRQPRPGEAPLLVSDSPFGPVVDQRLLHWLRESDTRGKYRSAAEMIEAVERENRERQREKQHQSFEKHDPGKLYWGMQRIEAERQGKPLGLMTTVPAQIGSQNAGK